ncbi:MAG: glutamine synthetase, partial [Waddliaceae bacterium]
SFMQEVEQEAIDIGIPIKTRHNEVAPAQYEFACVYESGSIALDHNLLLMELLEKVAVRHHLACLLHEKPFARLNGSGKHCNWSLVTDTGINLLDPTSYPEKELYFIILLTAFCYGISQHAELLRASIGSLGNDHRLGGHEAPPAITSIYLGQQLEELLDNIESKGSHVSEENHVKMSFGLFSFPEIPKHTTDRNRTSPIAFTGNKFEFRAIGSQANPAFAVTVINAVVSESLNLILDEIEEKGENLQNPAIALDVVRKYLKKSKNIRYSGDNYSDKWHQEAEKRKLPNIQGTPNALDSLVSSDTISLFNGILSSHELESRHQVLLENYANVAHIEISLILDLFRTSILPAAVSYQKELAKTLSLTAAVLKTEVSLKRLQHELTQLSELINEGLEIYDKLKERQKEIIKKQLHIQPIEIVKSALPIMEKLRLVIDQLEATVDHRKWPFPKYKELLFQL